MPPKKKVKNVEEQSAVPETAKKVDKSIASKPEEKKEQEKKQQPVPSTEATQPIKVQAPPAEKKENAPKEPEVKLAEASKGEEEKPKTVNFESADKLTEKEKIQLRKLRFGGGGIGTVGTVEEAEKTKQERMKKFGLNNPIDDPVLVQKRKSKFGGTTLNGSEDEEALKKRKEKFGNEGPMVAEDQDKIEERKKKFGNSEGDIVLDEEIKKSKGIKKQQRPFEQGNRGHGGGGNFHNSRRFNR